jgi:hypothetical protein
MKSHNAENMIDVIITLLVELDMTSKVLRITTDNEPAMVDFGRETKKNYCKIIIIHILLIINVVPNMDYKFSR